MSKPPVRPVLVPGLGLDERSSARLRELLPADVVLLPGTGLTGPVPPLEELAAALRARLGEGPVLLVGHSQSCQVVAAAAGDPRVAAGAARAAAVAAHRTAGNEPVVGRALARPDRRPAADRPGAGDRRPRHPGPAVPARLGRGRGGGRPAGRLVEIPGLPT